MSQGQAAVDVLAGGGELGERMRAIDWATTPLGPVDAWPQSLKTCIRIILTSSQPMFVWWGEQLINLYNDAYCSILGGKHPWALGRPASEVWREIWDDVGPRAAAAIRENRGTFDEALLLIMERNGYREETYYTFSYSPVPGDFGGPGGILCANSSDTQRIFGERQQALLRDVGAVTADARTVGVVCERVVRALAGNARDLPFAMLYLLDGAPRLAGTSGIAATHPLCARLDLLPVAEVARTGELQTCSLAGVVDLPMGPWDEVPSEAVGVPVGGDAVLVVARNPYRRLDADYRRFLELLARQIASAIGAAKAYAAERQRAEQLAELDRAKTTFFSNISHEFRTPLTLMIGPTEDALRTDGRTLAGDALESVHRNELRLLKLVNALLDFSRIEAGRVRAHFEPTDLARLTRELASAFRSAMERAHLRFEVAADDLHEPVYVDHAMWEKIVLNLLSNALKFTFDGGVRVALREAGDHVELVVEDTGTGIPADELPRLFERFHRVEGAKSRTHEGSGIGLALAHELVKLHHGDITAESTLGKGTRFVVRIPKGREHLPVEHIDDAATPAAQTGISAYVEEAMRWLGDDPPAVHEPARTDDPLAHANAGAKILVADDNADMRDYLRRLLGERWHVTVVRDGERALEAARRERPDLVLTDVMMPVLDGFGLLRALRGDPDLTSVPVVMLSARAGEEARIEGIEAGADDYLIKPFSARELLARVSNMLQLARLRRDVEIERNRLTTFMHQIPVGVAIFEGPDHRFALCNDGYRDLIGREPRIGVPITEILPDLVGTASIERLDRAYLGEVVDSPEGRVVFRGPDGDRVRYFRTAIRPVRNVDGEVTAVISVSVDITEQVVARKTVEQSRSEAEQANRAKDEFLAMLGHELRNPLAPIQTALELMRLRDAGAFERERAVIERQAQHLTGLVDDLLDVSRITRGMVSLRKERVSLSHVIAKAIETAAPLFEQQNHQLFTSVAPDLVVDGDDARLTQVFANLLTNAAKYTDTGGRIAVDAERIGDQIVVTVDDSGRGIAAEMLPRVFELFTQERQNLDRSRGGLGLGLAIVRSLVGLHGGTVDAESAGPGRGSTFRVRLPSAGAASIEAAPAKRVTESPVPSGVSVLIVDDNVDAADLLSELLHTLGYTTHVAHDGIQALALAQTFVPDVALLDIGLPAMDGYELARRLRELPSWRSVRLLAVTGYGQTSDKGRSHEAGFDHHLVKPIDIGTLQKLIPRA